MSVMHGGERVRTKYTTRTVAMLASDESANVPRLVGALTSRVAKIRLAASGRVLHAAPVRVARRQCARTVNAGPPPRELVMSTTQARHIAGADGGVYARGRTNGMTRNEHAASPGEPDYCELRAFISLAPR